MIFEEYTKKRKEIAKTYAKELLGEEVTEFVNPLTVLASPAWRGIEGDIWRAATIDKSIIIKHYHPDTNFYVDQKTAINAASQAGKLGAGPVVKDCRKEEGLVTFEVLKEPWQSGGLHHATNSEIRIDVIKQKKAFQSGAMLDKTTSIFDEIAFLYSIVRKENISTHKDIVPFMDFVNEAGNKLKVLGWDSKPCHRDGNTANLMIHPNHSICLIDFDLAANCDPFEDVGAYLIEFFANDIDARSGFEEWHGSFDEGLFQRSMIYGLADDLRWGLIGSIMGKLSPRSHLEFTKYAAWRFFRLETQAKRSDANDRIRVAT